jgi:hypothetical protein
VGECPLSGWSVEELDARLVVPDRSGQALAYIYYEEEHRLAMPQRNVIKKHFRELMRSPCSR